MDKFVTILFDMDGINEVKLFNDIDNLKAYVIQEAVESHNNNIEYDDIGYIINHIHPVRTMSFLQAMKYWRFEMEMVGYDNYLSVHRIRNES